MQMQHVQPILNSKVCLNICCLLAVTSISRCLPQDSHDDSKGRRTALQQFWADLDVVRRVLRPLAGSLQGVFPSGGGVQPRLIA